MRCSVLGLVSWFTHHFWDLAFFFSSLHSSSDICVLLCPSFWRTETFASTHASHHTWVFSSIQLLSRVRLFATPWTVAHRPSCPSPTPKLMFIESVIPSNHLILRHPLLLPPSSFPSIRVFSNESALCIRWPKYWSFSFISPSNEHSGLIMSNSLWPCWL